MFNLLSNSLRKQYQEKIEYLEKKIESQQEEIRLMKEILSGKTYDV
jgi:hypothetical protein